MMIDFEKLKVAYEQKKLYALQLEVGETCQLGCAYCATDMLTQQRNKLESQAIVSMLDEAARLGVSVVEWIGGEPLTRVGVFELMAHAKSLGMQNNVWSGGLSLSYPSARKALLKNHNGGLIAFRLTSITPNTFRKIHVDRPISDIQTVLDSVKQLLAQGFPSSRMLNVVTYTGLQTANDLIETMRFFEDTYGIASAVNIYRSENNDTDGKFTPSLKELHKVFDFIEAQMERRGVPDVDLSKMYEATSLLVRQNGNVSLNGHSVDSKTINIKEKGLAAILEHYQHEAPVETPFMEPTELEFSSNQCQVVVQRSSAFYGVDPRKNNMAFTKNRQFNK